MTVPPQHCDAVPGKSMSSSAKVSPTSVQYPRRYEDCDTDDDFDFGGVSCRRSIPLFCLHSLLIRQWKLFLCIIAQLLFVALKKGLTLKMWTCFVLSH